MRYLHTALWIFAIYLLGAQIPAAHAQTETILVVGVMADGALDPRLTERLERYLRSTERIISARDLRAEERRCRESRCLLELAQRKGAAVLLFGEVTTVGKGEAELNLFKMQTATKTWHRRGDVVPQERLGERLEQLVREVLSGQSAERPRTSTTPLRLNRRVSVDDLLARFLKAVPQPRPLLSEAGRKRLGISLLAAGGLSLGAAVVLSILGTKYNTPERCFANGRDDCVDRGLPLSISGYTVGGSLALAGALTFVIPMGKKGEK